MGLFYIGACLFFIGILPACLSASADPQSAAASGNFPAFWMMPQTQLTWPNSGEIDIWEQINSDNMSHHTIHSAWGNKTLGQPDQESPVKTASAPCTVACICPRVGS